MNIYAAIHRLAAAHQHEWAAYVSEEECARDWSSACETAINAVRERDQRSGPPLIKGIDPATSHRTGSGRLIWYVTPESTLALQIRRPNGMDYEGYMVCEAELAIVAGRWRVNHLWFDADPDTGAFLRHVQVLEAAMIAASKSDIKNICELLIAATEHPRGYPWLRVHPGDRRAFVDRLIREQEEGNAITRQSYASR